MTPACPWGSTALPAPHCWTTQSHSAARQREGPGAAGGGARSDRGRGQQPPQEVAATESCQLRFKDELLPEVLSEVSLSPTGEKKKGLASAASSRPDPEAPLFG